MSQSLWGHVNGYITQPANGADDLPEWDKQNTIAIGTLVLRTKENIQQDIIDLPTSSKVWTTLKDCYGTPSSMSIYKDFKETLTIRINPASHPGPQIDRMAAAFAHLSATNMAIPAQVQTMILLAALPQKWEFIVPIVTTNYDLEDLEFSNACDAVIDQYTGDSTCKGKQQHAHKISAVKRKCSNPQFSKQEGGQQQPQQYNNGNKPFKPHGKCGGKKKQQDSGHSHIADVISLPPPSSSTIAHYTPAGISKHKVSVPEPSTHTEGPYKSLNNTLTLADRLGVTPTIEMTKSLEQCILKQYHDGTKGKAMEIVAKGNGNPTASQSLISHE